MLEALPAVHKRNTRNIVTAVKEAMIHSIVHSVKIINTETRAAADITAINVMTSLSNTFRSDCVSVAVARVNVRGGERVRVFPMFPFLFFFPPLSSFLFPVSFPNCKATH